MPAINSTWARNNGHYVINSWNKYKMAVHLWSIYWASVMRGVHRGRCAARAQAAAPDSIGAL